MNSVIKRVLSDDWSSLQADIELQIADKIKAKIAEKKVDVLANLNNISVDKIKEMMTRK